MQPLFNTLLSFHARGIVTMTMMMTMMIVIIIIIITIIIISIYKAHIFIS